MQAAPDVALKLDALYRFVQQAHHDRKKALRACHDSDEELLERSWDVSIRSLFLPGPLPAPFQRFLLCASHQPPDMVLSVTSCAKSNASPHSIKPYKECRAS